LLYKIGIWLYPKIGIEIRMLSDLELCKSGLGLRAGEVTLIFIAFKFETSQVGVVMVHHSTQVQNTYKKYTEEELTLLIATTTTIFFA
jgi:hypothetical protein